MKFIIQHNLMNEDQLRLTKDAVEYFPHEFIGLIPFSREITSEGPLDGVDFIPYGSTLLTSLTKDLGWKGLHFDLSTFNYKSAKENRHDMLNDFIIMRLDEAIKFLQYRPDNEIWFIRPSEDLKQFSGQLIEAKECHEWLSDAMLCDTSGSYRLDADTMIVLAEPQNIQAEWRWFIVDRKIISGSMYRCRNQLVKIRELDQKVIDEAQSFADKWLPDSCCVMDLALINESLKVIEFNCINSSGFYNHDVNKIFKELYEFHTNDVSY
jgi:hypothetical protein